ncbi:hypothetical protein HDK77DRAFT_427601 [Phyllosticta capitalensis]|uniref:Uncharacterized protein n=1 Tax=Phyllosticta capitalensis TaxID=121624 RepID=A0ABR1YL28_9PEZI
MGSARRPPPDSEGITPPPKKAKLTISTPNIPAVKPPRSKDNKQKQRAGRSIVTRSKAALMRAQFPFLRLPAELRNIVYEFTLDFDGVQDVVNKHYEAHITDDGYIPWSDLYTPAILLVNKQIYREARFVLHRQVLTIPHSTTPNADITDVISRPLLQKLRKVNITRDLSHGENHVWCDMLEYFQLIKSAVGIWDEQHHLQELTIDLHADVVLTHLDVCPASGHCYFLDEIKMLVEAITTLRGIKKVHIGGFLAPHAKNALELMSLPPAYLLKAPAKVRQRIIGYVLDWNDANSALVNANRSIDGPDPERLTRMAPPLTTPSLLLTNKQLLKEADRYLKDRPFTISAPPPRSTAPGTKIDNFIAKYTLQHVEHLRLDIHSHGSYNTLQDWKYLISELADRLKFRHSLRTLHINVMDGEWARDEVNKATDRPPCSEDYYGLNVLGNISSQRMVEKKLNRLSWEGRVDESTMKLLQTKLEADDPSDDDFDDPEQIILEF